MFNATPAGYTITEEEYARGKIMWHVFIQWLASKDMLVPWMESILYLEDHQDFSFYAYQMMCIQWNAERSSSPIREVRKEDGYYFAYDFLNYRVIGPGHGMADANGRNVGEQLCYEWQCIRDRTVKRMLWVTDTGET